MVLVKSGSDTHAYDMEQRLLGLTFTAISGALTVNAPPNPNLAPPGYYMLFVLNRGGAIGRKVCASVTEPDGSATQGNDYRAYG
jgi:Domain of unknown function (DUF1929)